jgi:hypothetical protein
MFDSNEYPTALHEDVFETWLENGRLSKMPYEFLLVVWDAYERTYIPVYAEHRDVMEGYERYGSSTGRESLVAAYSLYSESRIL